MNFSEKKNITISTANEQRNNVNLINVQEVKLDNAVIEEGSLVNAVKMVSGNDGSKLSATRIKIVNVDNKASVSIAGTGTTMVSIPKTRTIKEGVADFYYFQEIIGVNDTSRAQEKAQHSLSCYDMFSQTATSGGKMTTCTADCKNFTEDGYKLHYHATEGIIVQVSEQTEEAIEGKGTTKKQTGTLKKLDAVAATKLYYHPTAFAKDASGNVIKMTADRLTCYQYVYSSECTVTHLGATYNTNHNDNNHNDGCVLKMVYKSGSSTVTKIIQPYSLDVSSEAMGKISVGECKTDVGHEGGKNAASASTYIMSKYPADYTQTSDEKVDRIVQDSVDSVSGVACTIRTTYIGKSYKDVAEGTDSNSIPYDYTLMNTRLVELGFVDFNNSNIALSDSINIERKEDKITEPYIDSEPVANAGDYRCPEIDLSNMQVYGSINDTSDSSTAKTDISLSLGFKGLKKAIMKECSITSLSVQSSSSTIDEIDFSGNKKLGGGSVYIKDATHEFNYNNGSWQNATSLPSITNGLNSGLYYSFDSGTSEAEHGKYELMKFKIGSDCSGRIIKGTGWASHWAWGGDRGHGWVYLNSLEYGINEHVGLWDSAENNFEAYYSAALGERGGIVTVSVEYGGMGHWWTGGGIKFTFYPFGVID